MNSLHMITQPESVRPNQRYWLRDDGAGFEVSDHLKSAQYVQAASDESDRQVPWGYEDMFRHGWVRVHIENNRIWADGAAGRTATPQQQQWLAAAKKAISGASGDPAVLSAIEHTHQAGATNDPQTAPTRSFLQKIGFKKS